MSNRARPTRRPSLAPASTPTCYLERALLLWPRLDRARLRRIADDPVRIAALVVRRTSQPFEVVLEMLIRGVADPMPLDRGVAPRTRAMLRARVGRPTAVPGVPSADDRLQRLTA